MLGRMSMAMEALLTSGSLPARAARLVWAALKRYLAAGGLRQGAAVAFYAAFSIAPLIVVVTAIMVWLIGSDEAQRALFDAVSRLLGPSEAHSLADLVNQRPPGLESAARAQSTVFGSWLALSTTVIGATGVFIELRAALQTMLAETDGDFSWWRLVRVRLLAIGIVLGCGFMLPVAMLAQAVSLLTLHWAAHTWPLLAPLLGVAETLWSWGVITLMFALLIRWLPNTRLKMRHALSGAAIASAFFILGRYAISLYIAHSATQSALGAAGSFAVLLVWVYWSSQIFLLGAAAAVELDHVTRHGREAVVLPSTR